MRRRPFGWEYKGISDVEDVVQQIIHREGLDATFLEYNVLVYFVRVIGGKHIKPVSYHKEVLRCVVDSPVWNQQYTMMKSQILDKLQAGNPPAPIRDIRFAVGSLDDNDYISVIEKKDEFGTRLEKQKLSEKELQFISDSISGVSPELRQDLTRTLELLLKHRKLRGIKEDGEE